MEANSVGIPESSLDFSFAFDDPKYSDKILVLEIMGVEDDDNGSDLVPSLKRRRRHRHDLLRPTIAASRVKTIHVSSLILAARSPFFRNLFSNGMLETEHKHVTLQTNSIEEVSFMDLLKYVYSNNLPSTLDALLGLLVIADKYEIATCMRDCTRALQDMPMTCELVSVYFDLPPYLLTSPSLKPLIDAAKKFLVDKYKDLDRHKEEVVNLPLLSIQTILSSDELQVTSECVVYDFVLTWVRKHYPDLEERRGVLKTQLLHLVRFPFMATTKLTEEVQTCSDIDPEVASKIVIRALGFKAETPHRKHCLAAEETNAGSRQFVERAYKLRPVKMVELASPHQHYIVYFDLTREEVNRTCFRGDQIRSETFHVEGVALTFVTTFLSGSQGAFCLGLEIVRSTACTLNYVFALRRNPSMEFEIVRSTVCALTYQFALRRNPSMEFESWAKDSLPLSTDVTWHFWPVSKLRDDSIYFVNDVFHVRAVITVKK